MTFGLHFVRKHMLWPASTFIVTWTHHYCHSFVPLSSVYFISCVRAVFSFDFGAILWDLNWREFFISSPSKNVCYVGLIGCSCQGGAMSVMLFFASAYLRHRTPWPLFHHFSVVYNRTSVITQWILARISAVIWQTPRSGKARKKSTFKNVFTL